MKYAIFSDVHANLVAWQAVQQDIARCEPDVLVCLGDLVGYGPRPIEVLEQVSALTPNIVIGNHDAAAIGAMDYSNFNDRARHSTQWTAEALTPQARDFLSELPLKMEADGMLFVHAEVCQPERFEYVDSAERALVDFLAGDHRLTFMGHTHHPELFEWSGDGEVLRHPPEDRVLDPGRRYIINVGSVGDPRDPQDLRARHAIYDSESGLLEFRAVPFDFQACRADLEKSSLGLEPYYLLAAEQGPGGRKSNLAEAVPATPLLPNARTLAGLAAAPPPRPVLVNVPSARPVMTSPTLGSGTKGKRSTSGGVAALLVTLLIAGIAGFVVWQSRSHRGGVKLAANAGSATPEAPAGIEPQEQPPPSIEAEPHESVGPPPDKVAARTVGVPEPEEESPDIVFEDFESATYADWTVEGTAFGSGPVVAAQMPVYQGAVGAHGQRLVNSHHTRGGEDDVQGDAHTGVMTSKPFTIERDYIHALVGGGANLEQTALQLLIGDEVVDRLAGDDHNALSRKSMPVAEHRGETARLRIIDHGTQGWGNLGVDHIVFSDDPQFNGGPLAAGEQAPPR